MYLFERRRKSLKQTEEVPQTPVVRSIFEPSLEGLSRVPEGAEVKFVRRGQVVLLAIIRGIHPQHIDIAHGRIDLEPLFAIQENDAVLDAGYIGIHRVDGEVKEVSIEGVSNGYYDLLTREQRALSEIALRAYLPPEILISVDFADIEK